MARVFTALVLLVPVLAGCGTVNDTPSFRDGYGDGCATANAASPNMPRPPIRDRARYSGDKDYSAGWSAGRGACSAPDR